VASETQRDGAKSRGGSSASVLSVSVLVGLVALALRGGVLLFLVTCAGSFVVLSVPAICSWASRESSAKERLRGGVVEVTEGVRVEDSSVQRGRWVRFED